jgi:predicted Zn-dependent protease
MALAQIAAGRYAEAADWAQRLRQRRPEYSLAYLVLAGAYVQLERIEEAQSALEEALRLNPDFSLGGIRLALAAADASLRERIIDGLRKAGLPE